MFAKIMADVASKIGMAEISIVVGVRGDDIGQMVNSILLGQE